MSDFRNRNTLDRNRYEGLRALVRLGRGLSGREITGLYLQVKNTCKGEGEYSGWSPQFYGLLGLNWTGNAGRYAIPDGIGYDMNGNIQTMKRNGVEDVQSNVVVWGAMDEMTYHYNGNQLESIEDNVAYTGGVFEQFRKQTPYTGNAEYLYDGNGNIVQDVNKGVEVSYNYLNKPILIDFGGGHRMEYVYTADGRKLRERIKQPGQLEVKGDYPLGGLYYRDNGLVYISTAEGRVLQTGSSIDLNTGKVLKDFRYEYYLKDHLGNVRFLFTDTDTDGVPEILQEDAYDPWGIRLAGLSYTQGEKNVFLYNGKEQVKGLGSYDYGFRWYMPDVGRFLGADPLAEKFPWLTTYQYGSNNPVLNIDLDGLEGVRYTVFEQLDENHKIPIKNIHEVNIKIGLTTNPNGIGFYVGEGGRTEEEIVDFAKKSLNGDYNSGLEVDGLPTEFIFNVSTFNSTEITTYEQAETYAAKESKKPENIVVGINGEKGTNSVLLFEENQPPGTHGRTQGSAGLSLINRNDEDIRKSHAISHEIGHYLLRNHREKWLNNIKTEAEHERAGGIFKYGFTNELEKVNVENVRQFGGSAIIVKDKINSGK